MFDSYESTVGERIRYYRKRAGMTQKQLAQACGISEPAIRNYELDNRIPSMDKLEDIAYALNISYYALEDAVLGAYAGAMHCFFRLEYAHGLRPILIDGKPGMVFDSANNATGHFIITQMMMRWCEARLKLDSGEWTLDQYETWESRFPFSVIQDPFPEKNPKEKRDDSAKKKGKRHTRSKKAKKK